MGRFVRLEIRLVIMGINLWRGAGHGIVPPVPAILPVRPANGLRALRLRDAHKWRVSWRKAQLVPVLAFPGISVASIAIAKRQLKLAHLCSSYGGFFAWGHGIWLAQRDPTGLMAARNRLGPGASKY